MAISARCAPSGRYWAQLTATVSLFQLAVHRPGPQLPVAR